MQKLVQGIHDFQANVFRSQRELFERLADGQHPDALFITCSDSRINPKQDNVAQMIVNAQERHGLTSAITLIVYVSGATVGGDVEEVYDR